MNIPSTKPYLIRAIYEWCGECGYTPLLSVKVSSEMNLPPESVKNGEIIFNIDHGAVHNLVIGNDIISFSARFKGIAKEISFSTNAVKGIFAREVNQGIAFPDMESNFDQTQNDPDQEKKEETPVVEKPATGKKGKTQLRIVK